MNPTVSLNSTGPQPGSCQRRVRVSSVANRASCTNTSAPVSAFISVLLPAFV